MRVSLSRRFLLCSAAAWAGCAGFAAARPPKASVRPMLRPQPASIAPSTSTKATAQAVQIIENANLGGQVCYAVADAKTGEILEEFGGEKALPPASVAKAITALYALDMLGAKHRFHTRVMATTPLKNGVIDGDLVLVGGGDPSLDTEGLAELARQVKATGLREIRGRFLVWGGALPATAQIDQDQPQHVGYNPAISGLALNYNRVFFEWKRSNSGYAITMDARSLNYRPDVQIARMKLAERTAPVYTYNSRGNVDHWTVARSALGNGGGRWLPVRRPALYAAEVFATLMRAHGIVLPPEAETTSAPTAQAVLAELRSAPLDDLLREMLKYSTNLSAEMIGLASSQADGSRMPNLAASARKMSRWAEQAAGVEGIDLVDHSGLGDTSRLSPRALVALLQKAHVRQNLRPLMKPFLLRDEKGRPKRNHPVQVAAKTGTLNFVSSLGGFATCQGGRDVVFAIFAANTQRRAAIPEAQKERPPGARAWNGRAKTLQARLIEHWDQRFHA